MFNNTIDKKPDFNFSTGYQLEIHESSSPLIEETTSPMEIFKSQPFHEKESLKRKRFLTSIHSPMQKDEGDEATISTKKCKTSEEQEPEKEKSEEDSPRFQDPRLLMKIREAALQRCLRLISIEQQKSLNTERGAPSHPFLYCPCIQDSTNPVGRIQDVFYIPCSEVYECIDQYELSNVPIQYQKDELISKLRSLKAYEGASKPLHIRKEETLPSLEDLDLNSDLFKDLTSDQIDKAIRAIQKMPSYIDKSNVIKRLGFFSKDLRRRILRELPTYFSSYDLYSFKPETAEHLRAPNWMLFTEFNYAIKSGDENVRELLSQQLLLPLGLCDHVLLKVKTNMPHIKLGEAVHVEGMIGSKWLGEISFPEEKFEKLLVLHNKLETEMKKVDFLETCISKADKNQWEEKEKETLAALGLDFMDPEFDQYLQEDLQEGYDFIDKKKGQIKDCEEKIRIKLGFKPDNFDAQEELEEVIREHALIDILFWTSDSHPGQYIFKNGIPICVDFAKYLPLRPVYSQKNGQIQVTFKSFFFDHPASKKPLSDQMIAKIKGWNIEELEAFYVKEGLIGDPAKFALKDAEMQDLEFILFEFGELSVDQSVAQERLERIRQEVGAKYGIEVPGDINLLGALNQWLSSISRECFSQIHPQAFAEFKKRLLNLQEYVSQTDSPTIQGAFHFFYPDLSLFMKALSRCAVIQPGYVMSDFSLNDILAPLQEGGEDTQEIEEAFDRLQLQAIPEYQIALTKKLWYIKMVQNP